MKGLEYGATSFYGASTEYIFQPAFSTPTYHRFLVLLLGAILTTGRRTITNICRTVRPYAQSCFLLSPSVFSDAGLHGSYSQVAGPFY